MRQPAQQSGFCPRPQRPIIYEGCCRLSDLDGRSATYRQIRCFNHSDPRPAAENTFAGKGSDHAHHQPSAPVRPQAGMAHAVWLPDGQGIRHHPGLRRMSAVCSQARGSGRRPIHHGRVSPDAVFATATARHGTHLRARPEASPGIVKSSLTPCPRRNPTQARQIRRGGRLRRPMPAGADISVWTPRRRTRAGSPVPPGIRRRYLRRGNFVDKPRAQAGR
jgi:hypothetical protein